jgi:hypothetical protein
MLFPQGDKVMPDLWYQHYSEACSEATCGRSRNAMQQESTVFSLSPSKQDKQDVMRVFCFKALGFKVPSA